MERAENGVTLVEEAPTSSSSSSFEVLISLNSLFLNLLCSKFVKLEELVAAAS